MTTTSGDATDTLRRGSSGLLGILVLAGMAAGLLALSPGRAEAQVPNVVLDPTGPFVQPSPVGGDPLVARGRPITWEMVLQNPQATDATVDVRSHHQHVECEPGGVSEPFPPDDTTVSGNAMETAPQTALFIPDADMDGDCADEPGVVVEDGGGAVLCDAAAQEIVFDNVFVPAASGGFPPIPGTTLISWKTWVDAAAPLSSSTCNWAHILNPLNGELIQNSAPQTMGVQGCTCLVIQEDMGFDALVEKIDMPDTTPLIPGDPTATIVYEIRVTNTGEEDLMGGTLSDVVGPDLEWVEIVECEPPLTCSDPTVDPTTLTVNGWDLPAGMDPPATQRVLARARVTCAAATDDDTGEVCNQGEFQFMTLALPTDDPDAIGDEDATCTPVIFSDLTQSEKQFNGYDDTNRNGQLDPGERVSFVIRAINEGRLEATDVVVTDDVGAAGCWDVATIDASASGGTVTGGVITWDVPSLASGGGSVDLEFSVELAVDTLCCNQATLQSQERIDCGLTDEIPTDDMTTPDTDDPACASPGPQPDITITKEWCLEPEPAAGCPGEASVGDLINWTVTITNGGDGAATAAQFVDDFDMFPCNAGFNGMVTGSTTDGTDWGDASGSTADTGGFPRDFGMVVVDQVGGANGIIPGETITLEFTTQVFMSVDGCCNQGQLTYAERFSAQPTDDPTTPGLVDDETCLIATPPEPDGSLIKTRRLRDVAGGEADGFISIGDRVDYTLTFTNTGSEELTNVMITDSSLPCVDFDISTVSIIADDSGSAMNDSAGEDVVISIGSIMPTEQVTIVFTGTITALGECCNQSAWTSDQAAGGGEGISDDDPDDFLEDQPTCFTSVDVPTPDVSVQKSHDGASGCQDPGGAVNYTLEARNDGSADVDTWSLLDDLGADVTCADVTADPALTCDDSVSPTTLSVDSASEGPLAAGSSMSWSYTITTPCDAAGGTSAGGVVLSYDDGGMMRTASDTAAAIEWGWPDLTTSEKTVEWTADTNGNDYIDTDIPAENLFTYTITVSNTGSCPARNVVVSDPLPAEFDPTLLNVLDGGAFAAGEITWTIASLDAGASMDVRFEVGFLDSTEVGTEVRNTFSITMDNDPSACEGMGTPLPEPGLADEDALDLSPSFGEPIVAGTIDVLWHATASGGDLSLILRPEIPNEVAPRSCGSTRLATGRGAEVAAADVDPAAGPIVIDTLLVSDDVLVFIELTNYCDDPADAEFESFVVVRKGATPDEIVVEQVP